jgi:purine-nucleoside phosphorylase
MGRRMSTETIHLRPHEDVAERVLLPGDPGRALRLAQQLITGVPKMLNHHRGLWGYSGMAHDGAPLTVQATGMGGPSAAIVAEELIVLGARRLLRVGTCGALVEGLALGQLLAAEAALPEDGASRALGATAPLPADPDLHAGLQARSGLVVSADLFYDPDPGRATRWTAAGAIAVEMEAATVLRIAERSGAAAACVLAVSDVLADGERERIEPEALEHAEAALGHAGAGALGVPAA